MLYLALFIFLYWLIRGVDLIIGTLFWIPRLRAIATGNRSGGPLPKVSVIFAARNEATHIHDAVSKLLCQDYPNLEIVAVNDRSEDKTQEILNSIKDPRLKQLNISELPKGWLGKTHALYEGSLLASGEWLLFTDADVKFDAHTVTAAMQEVEHRQLDHLTLFPNVELRSYFETMFVSYFSLTFNMRFRVWAARSPRSKAYVGIGAFQLMRKTCYEKAGTHKALALDIADDMMLGKRLKRVGCRQMGMLGDRFISVRWVEGAKGVMGALHKNGFRGLDYNFLYLVIITFGMFTVDILPFIGLFFVKGVTWALFASAIGMIGLVYLAGCLYVPATILAFPAHPFGSLLFAVILWRSALYALFQGGVSWRGTVYPLKELRQNSEEL